jgi:hypothetical protein
MSIPVRHLLVLTALATIVMPARAVQLPPAPALTEAQLAAKCKAASFARNPPGQQSKTMREMAIDRCIKNKGFLD